MITSPSGRRYIGQTGNVIKRKCLYKGLKCKKQRLLYNSLAKYGFINHTFEVIALVDNEFSDEAEVNYIEYHKTYWLDKKQGLNLTRGGSCAKFTPEIKKKISKSLMGNKNVKSKKLYQYSLEGVFIKEWECMKRIEREINIFSTTLSQALKNGNYCKGFLWSYDYKESLPKHILTKSQERYLLHRQL